MMRFRDVLCLITCWTLSGPIAAQDDPDADIETEMFNTSINLEINTNDSVQLGTIIDPGFFGGDVDILVTAISREVDPGFDPDMEIRTRGGVFLAANDDWQRPEGGQIGFLHDVIRCYVDEGLINPASTDAVVLLSVSRDLAGGDTRIIADVNDVDGFSGRTVISILRVDGTLWDTHRCSDI